MPTGCRLARAVKGDRVPAIPVSFSRSRLQSTGAWLATLALLALSTGVAAGAKEPPSPPAVSSEISVTVAEIPVEVTRGSEAVQGLTAADFEVTEKGRPLPVVGFETVDLGSPAEKRKAPPSQAARRHFFLLFDLAFSRPERLAEGITAARTLVAGSLDPGDMLAVGVYLPKGEIPLLLNFTADRAAVDRTLATLAAVLERKAPPGDPAAKPDPLRLTGSGVLSFLFPASGGQERNYARDLYRDLNFGDHSWGGFLIANILNHSSALHQPNVEAYQSSHVKALGDAMEGLATALRPVTGRKYLTLFSEGFAMTNDNPNSESNAVIGGSSLLKKLDQVVGELRRSGWVLHAVDLAGTRGGAGADGLFFLAHETGGTLVEGTNKLAEGMAAALRPSAHGYVLAVQVDAAPDGSYHPVEVRLRQPLAHTELHHRGGYFAPLPFRRQDEVQRLTEAARLVAGDEERNELGVRAVAVPLHAAGPETTPVAVVVEIPGETLLATGASRLGVDVFGYALSETGSESDFFAQAVGLDRAKAGARLAQGGVRVLASLYIPPGRHRLRVLVRNRDDGRLALLSLPLSLTAPGAETKPRLDALFLAPQQDPWLLVRSGNASFSIHDGVVLPTAQAALPPAGEAQLLLLGRGFTGKGAWIKGKILTAEGKAVEGGALDLQAVTPGAADGEPDLVMARLRAGTLPAGNYLLDLRLGQGNAVQATTGRPFTVAAPGAKSAG
jgi:VWFA-related protein